MGPGTYYLDINLILIQISVELVSVTNTQLFSKYFFVENYAFLSSFSLTMNLL